MILGIDDAGRGPIIGPMILAGVLLTKEQEEIMKENEVRDSKMVTQNLRLVMERVIKENSVAHKIVKASPDLIDGSLNSGTNLNELEAKMAAKIINSINKDLTEKIKVIIDCPSVNVDSWKISLMNYIDKKDNLEISCEQRQMQIIFLQLPARF